MKHPYSDLSREQVAELAGTYLPDDGVDWLGKCLDAIDWLTDRANENGVVDGDWFRWRASDPVHVASLAFERMAFAYQVGLSSILEKPSPAYEAGMRRGWGALLAKMHGRRMSQYIEKKSQGATGERHDEQ